MFRWPLILNVVCLLFRFESDETNLSLLFIYYSFRAAAEFSTFTCVHELVAILAGQQKWVPLGFSVATPSPLATPSAPLQRHLGTLICIPVYPGARNEPSGGDATAGAIGRPERKGQICIFRHFMALLIGRL